MSVDTDFEVPGEARNDDYWYNFGYEGLDLAIEGYAYDGGELGSYGIQGDEIDAYDAEWDELRIEGHIVVPNGLLDFVFEDGVVAEEVGKILVIGDCIETHRRFVADEVEELHPGEVTIEATFQRDLLSGTVDLEPVLVRAVEPDEGDEDYRYGQIAGQKLADGSGVHLHVDEPDDVAGSFLEIISKRFDDPLPEDNVFDLDHSPADDPTFYVNSRVDLLVPALKNRAPYGSKRWTREVLERLIAHPVWLELVLWTAADLEDGECRHSWQETVLEIISEHVYGGRSTDEVAVDLESRISEPDRIPYLVEELNESLQQYFEPRTEIENLLEEVL